MASSQCFFTQRLILPGLQKEKKQPSSEMPHQAVDSCSVGLLPSITFHDKAEEEEEFQRQRDE